MTTGVEVASTLGCYLKFTAAQRREAGRDRGILFMSMRGPQFKACQWGRVGEHSSKLYPYAVLVGLHEGKEPFGDWLGILVVRIVARSQPLTTIFVFNSHRIIDGLNRQV